jgi:Tachylectin/FG-GAP-like repeat
MLRQAGRTIAALAAAGLVAGVAPGAARADWNGDAKADVLTIHPDGRLLMYRGNGAGGWLTGAGEPIGSGWGSFTALMWPGDFSGDAQPDLLARSPDGSLRLYRSTGAGGFVDNGIVVGSGWGSFTALLAPGDFSGDGRPDVLARRPDGALVMYRGNGTGGWLTGRAEPIGAGWQQFTAILPGGDFSGDGNPDVLARTQAGALLMYRGNGRGGWLTGRGEPIGAGWQPFTALASGGDFSGDGKPDILARPPDGTLRLYRGTGTGGFVDNGVAVGSGWNTLSYLTLVGEMLPPRQPASPPAAPVPDGSVRLTTGLRCTPPGGRLRVSLRVRRRSGRARPRVRRVVFFVRGGPRRRDRRRPYAARLRLNLPAGETGRVYARVYYRRAGSRRIRHKTVSRRFVICG